MIAWDSYRYFLAVAETGSFSAASRRLRVSQPTIGRQIQELETRLEARLFERSPQGYALTPAGRHIHELARQMEREALSIERRVSGEDARPIGRVCIATTECLGTFWLAAKLPELRRRCPGVEIELVLGIPMVDLLRREADLALRVGSPGSEELVGGRVGTAAFGLYGSQSYLAVHGEPKSLADLAGHTVIESTREIANLVQAQRLREVAAMAGVALRCNSLLAQLAAVRAGLGLLALPIYTIQNTPELRRVLVEDFDLELDLWLLTHRDLRTTARIRAVRDFLASEIRRDAAVLTGVTAAAS